MGQKLYPPYVEASSPAQMVNENSTTATLRIPFQINKAVSWADLGEDKHMSLILKTVSTGKTVVDGLIGQAIDYLTEYNSSAALFTIDEADWGFKPIPGQYYKAQIAFVSDDDDDTVGYYSDVTVVKFTNEPGVSIEGLSFEKGFNTSKYIYTGLYETPDIGEKVYTYQFNIYNTTSGILHDTSGELLHNSSTDTARGKSTDTWTSYKTLKVDTQYNIEYVVTTVNGLRVSSGGYPIVASSTLDLVARNTEFVATLYPDDAYVHIHLLPKDSDATIKTITGNFVLMRSSSEDGFSSWNEIYRFSLANNYPLMTLWKDFTVQQGYSYKYAVQAYTQNGLYSNRFECKYYTSEQDEQADSSLRSLHNAETNKSYSTGWHYLTDGNGLPVDFEDAFLYDGERQLRIRYNPKVSSFKVNILESKIDTIGGKHPFIFRNGNVEYREFPIAGLITLLSDENELFLSGQSNKPNARQWTLHPPYLNIGNGPGFENLTELEQRHQQEKHVSSMGTALTAENFRKEREFKMEVLKWLTNGEPKLFRSPGEGNFIVRLMNTSLTPNDQLGRMLHNFQCTAYEMADYDFMNLEKYGFITARTANLQELKFKMIQTSDDPITFGAAYYFAVLQQYGNWMIRVTFSNGKSQDYNVGNSSGQFMFDKDALADNPIVSIATLEGAPDTMSNILYGYYAENSAVLTLITDIQKYSVVTQIIGHPKTTWRKDSLELNQVLALTDGLDYAHRQETFDTIPRTTLGKFYFLKAECRETTPLFLSSGKYYETVNLTKEKNDWDDTAIYEVFQKNDSEWKSVKKYSGRPSNNIVIDKPDYTIRFNIKPEGSDFATEELVDLSLRGSSANNAPVTTGRYELYFDLDEMQYLYVGSGIVCEIFYNLNVFTYCVEDRNSNHKNVVKAKDNWLAAKEKYENKLMTGASVFHTDVEKLRHDMESKYYIFIDALAAGVKAEQELEDSYYVL